MKKVIIADIPFMDPISIIFILIVIFILLFLWIGWLLWSKRSPSDMKFDHASMFIILEEATLGIIIVNSKSKIEFANPTAHRQFGYERGKLLDLEIAQLVPDTFKARHNQHMENFAHNPKSRPMGVGLALTGKKFNGDLFPLEISLTHYVYKQSQFVVAFIVDTTERKQQELSILNQKDELENLTIKLNLLNKELEDKVNERTTQLEVTVNKLLESSQKLQEEIKERKIIEMKLNESSNSLQEALRKEKEIGLLKSNFVSLASHEFRTPLSTINSSASLIAKYKDQDQQENRLKHVERIKSSIVLLTSILNEFLSLSKLEEGRVFIQKEETNLLAYCKDLAEEAWGLMKKDQVLQTNFKLDFGPVLIDPKICKTILLNIVSNAIKYTPEGKTIYFNSYLEVNEWIIEIKDEGIGIPVEDQKYLFERFFRAKNSGHIQGTGLGLHLVKNYLKLLEGDIQFKSEENQGSSFIVKIPI
jgi:PAS domain S-box-containing protein